VGLRSNSFELLLQAAARTNTALQAMPSVVARRRLGCTLSDCTQSVCQIAAKSRHLSQSCQSISAPLTFVGETPGYEHSTRRAICAQPCGRSRWSGRLAASRECAPV